MPFCPYCGELLADDATYCSHCGKDLKETTYEPQRKGLVEHLKFALNLSIKNPIIFIPEIIGSILLQGIYYGFGRAIASSDFRSYFESLMATRVSYVQYDYPDIPPEAMNTFLIIGLAVIIGVFLVAGISGLFTFANIKMIFDCYNGEAASLGNAFSYVRGRLGILFLGSIIANIFGVTIILLPAAFFTYVIMVVDEAGIRESLSKGFKLFMDNILASIAIMILFYVSKILVGYIPYISDQVFAIPSGVIIAAILDMYINQKDRKYLKGRFM